jgi:hypothetical protein
MRPTARAPLFCSLAVVLLVACAKSEDDDAAGGHHDAGPSDAADDQGATDSGAHGDSSSDSKSDSGSGSDSSTSDTGPASDSGVDTGLDTGAIDTGTADTGTFDTGTFDTGTFDTGTLDTGTLDTGHDTSTGPITGGPCLSGAPGATAFRFSFYDGGGDAIVKYEVDGLPDKSRGKAGTYGYTIPFTASYVDPFLAEGGVQLDGSDFIDVELSTVGLSTIRSVTLSVYGRSYDTTTSGSFNWMTFVDSGSTPFDFVSNVAPYAWYSADATSAFTPGDGGALLRIKAGPSSESLVVHRIELCVDAD